MVSAPVCVRSRHCILECFNRCCWQEEVLDNSPSNCAATEASSESSTHDEACHTSSGRLPRSRHCILHCSVVRHGALCCSFLLPPSCSAASQASSLLMPLVGNRLLAAARSAAAFLSAVSRATFLSNAVILAAACRRRRAPMQPSSPSLARSLSHLTATLGNCPSAVARSYRRAKHRQAEASVVGLPDQVTSHGPRFRWLVKVINQFCAIPEGVGWSAGPTNMALPQRQ